MDLKSCLSLAAVCLLQYHLEALFHSIILKLEGKNTNYLWSLLLLLLYDNWIFEAVSEIPTIKEHLSGSTWLLSKTR